MTNRDLWRSGSLQRAFDDKTMKSVYTFIYQNMTLLGRVDCFLDCSCMMLYRIRYWMMPGTRLLLSYFLLFRNINTVCRQLAFLRLESQSRVAQHSSIAVLCLFFWVFFWRHCPPVIYTAINKRSPLLNEWIDTEMFGFVLFLVVNYWGFES